VTEFAPHLAALQRCVDAGFTFRELPAGISGSRTRSGAIDVLLVRSYDQALAARYRLNELEYPRAQALWSLDGSVVGVVTDLLALPFHDERGAQSLAAHATDL